MSRLSSRYPNVQAVDTALNRGVDAYEKAQVLTRQLTTKADNTKVDELVYQIETKADKSETKKATANLQSQINNIVSPVTQDAEVQNARVGADGVSHATLKARLDSENSSLKENLNDNMFEAGGNNDFDSTNVSKNKSVNAVSDGKIDELIDYEGAIVSNDIYDIHAGDIIYYNRPWFSLAFYDADGNFVERKDISDTAPYNYTVSNSSAAKMRVFKTDGNRPSFLNTFMLTINRSLPENYVSHKVNKGSVAYDVAVSESELVNQTKAISDTVNYDFYFASPIVKKGERISLAIDNSGSQTYTYYLLHNYDGTERTKVEQAVGNIDKVITCDGEKNIVGIRVYIADATSDKGKVLSVVANRYSLLDTAYETIGVIEQVNNSKILWAGTTNINLETNKDLMFSSPITPKSALTINVKLTPPDTASRYKVYKLLSADGTSRETLKECFGETEIKFSVIDTEIVYGIRIYQISGTAGAYTINIATTSIEERLATVSTCTDVINNTEFIVNFPATTVKPNVNKDILFAAPLTMVGQGIYVEVAPELPIPSGNYYRIYKLLSADGDEREIIAEVNGTASVTANVNPGEIVHGIRIYQNGSTERHYKVSVRKIGLGERTSENPTNINVLHKPEVIRSLLGNLKWRKSSTEQSLTHSMLTLLHFSDLHGAELQLRRIMEFYSMHGRYIDGIIHTGDAVATCYEDDFSFWDNANAQIIMNVNGNHDCWTNGSNGLLAWSTGYSAKQCYERYIAPYKDIWGITSVLNKMYWYKDYNSSNVRIIAIDNYHWKETIKNASGTPVTKYNDNESVDKGEQLTWFNSVLADAKESGKSVIILTHAPRQVTPENTPFMELDPQSGGGLDNEAITAVQNFIDGGGKFITWIGGHNHQNWFGRINGHEDQLLITVDTARGLRADGTMWSDNNHMDGTLSMDCFNIVSVDTNTHLLRMHRIGTEYDRHGRHIGGLVYNYETHNLLWTE